MNEHDAEIVRRFGEARARLKQCDLDLVDLLIERHGNLTLFGRGKVSDILGELRTYIESDNA